MTHPAIRAYNYIRDREAGATHAEIVCGMIARTLPQACSLESGYMLTRDGRRVIFSDHYGNRTADAPRVVSSRRRRDGRVLASVYEYSDGSRVRYTWSEYYGPRYMPTKKEQ